MSPAALLCLEAVVALSVLLDQVGSLVLFTPFPLSPPTSPYPCHPWFHAFGFHSNKAVSLPLTAEAKTPVGLIVGMVVGLFVLIILVVVVVVVLRR